MGDLLDRVQVTLGGSKTKSAATKAIYTEVLRGIQDAKKKVLAGDWGPARDLIMKASESKAVLNKHRDGVVAALAANDADAMLTAIEGMAGRLTSTREKQSTPPSPDPDRPAPTNVVEELQQGMDHWELVETTPRINTATGKPAKVAHWTNAERQVPAQAVISVLRNASKHFAPEFSNRVAEILVKYGGATGLNTRAKLAGAYEEVTALMAEASGSMTTAPTVAPPVTVVGDEYVAQTPEPLKEEKAPTKGRKKVTLKPKTKTKAEPAPLPNVNIPYTSDAGYDALVNFQASIKGTKGRITTALKDFYEGHPWPAQDIRVSLAIVGDRLGKELTSKADVVEILEAFRQQQLEAKVIEQRAEKKRKAKLTKATAAVATDKPTGTQVREATEEVFDEDHLSDITDVLAEQEGEAGSNTSAAGVAEDQMTFTAGPQSADWAAELRVAKEQGTEDVKAALEEIDAFEKQGREDINAGDDHQSLKALARTDLKDEANRRRKQAVRGGGEYSESADEQIGDSFADPDANQPDQMDYDDGYESRKDKGDTDPLDRPISDEARRAFLDKNYIGQASELFHRIMRKGRGKGTLPIVFADKMASLIRSGKGEQGVAIDTVLEGFVTAFGKSHPWGQLANRMRRMDFGNASVTMSQRMPVVGDRTLMGLVNPSIVLSAVPNADGDYVDGSVSTASDVLITDTGLYHADAPAADTGNKGEFLHTILHEIIHLATLQTIREGGPGVAELEAIYLELTQMASDADIDAQYGFTNFAEFVAEAFSNPDFQKHLSKIPMAPKKGKIASAWDAILTAIRKIIGARSVPNSALDEVMRVGAPMFDKGWATRRTVHAEGDLLPLARDMSMEERPYERMPATQAEAARIVDSSPRIGVLRRNGEATSLVDFVGDEGDFSIFHPASGTYMNRKGPVNRAAKRAVEKSETARKVARVVSASKTGQLFTHSFNDIVDRFKGRFVVDGVSLLEKYRDSKEKQQAIVTTHRAAIDKIFQRVRAMGSSADRFDLAKLLKASTMERIDIAESWGSDTNKHWREHKSARIAAKKKALHEEMRRELGSLGKGREAIQHYRDLRDYFIQADADQKRFTVERLLKSDAKELGLRKVEGSQEFFDHEKITALAVELEGAKNKAAVSEIINRHVIDPEFKGVDKLATALRPILLTRRRAGPYFPLRRYGQYVVHAQRVTRSGFNTSEQAKEFAALINANAHSQYSEFSKAVVATKKAGDVNSPYIVEVTEQHTEFARSELEAEVAADKLRAAGDFTEPKVTTKNSFLQGVGNIAGASALAERLKAGVSDSGLKNTIDHTVMQMMELTAARQAQLTRESVAGASDDMYRAIADQAEAHAWIMSDMATVAEQQEMLSRMRDVGKEAGTKGGLTEVVNHLNTRDQQGLDKDRLSNHLDDLSSQAGYYLHLASISYSIVNLTQQILVGLPWLHKKYGFVQGTKLFMANSAMGARAAGSEVRRTRMGMLTPDQYMEQIDKIVTGKGQTGKAAALRHLVDTGLISATFIQELHNTKAGGITAGTGKDMLRKATNWTRNLPQLVEQYNRMTMAGAGYDGAIAKGMSHEQAVEMARKAVVETQFDYSGMNRPALFKMGPAPRTLFMFKMYAQGMYSLFVRESVGAMTSADPAAKKEALRFWVSFMGVNTIASGVLGGMMIEPLRAVASTIAAALGDEDDGIDWETEAKTMAFEWAQEQGMDHSTAAKFADALAYGITRGGDALPDFSNRVGLRNLLLMSTTNKSGTPEEAMQNAFVGVFGPMGDYVVKRLPKAYSKIRDGRAYEGVEAAMPKGVRDLMKAARRLQGGQKSVSSTETLPPMTVAEAVTQGVGFTTAKDARTYDAMGARYGYETAMKNRRQNLMYRLYRASGAERDRLFDTDITAWNNGPGQFDRNLRIHRKDMYKGLQDLRKRQRKVKGGTSPRLKSTDKAVPFSE